LIFVIHPHVLYSVDWSRKMIVNGLLMRVPELALAAYCRLEI